MFKIKQCHHKHTFFFDETYPSLYDALDYILYLCASETTYDIYFANTLFASVRKNGYRYYTLDLTLYSPKHTKIKMEFKSC